MSFSPSTCSGRAGSSKSDQENSYKELNLSPVLNTESFLKSEAVATMMQFHLCPVFREMSKPLLAVATTAAITTINSNNYINFIINYSTKINI